MKDSLDKQDKNKTVDIFQVMVDAIQKEFSMKYKKENIQKRYTYF